MTYLVVDWGRSSSHIISQFLFSHFSLLHWKAFVGREDGSLGENFAAQWARVQRPFTAFWWLTEKPGGISTNVQIWKLIFQDWFLMKQTANIIFKNHIQKIQAHKFANRLDFLWWKMSNLEREVVTIPVMSLPMQNIVHGWGKGQWCCTFAFQYFFGVGLIDQRVGAPQINLPFRQIFSFVVS